MNDPFPSGTVTFLFTDIEGSTRLLQELGERYAEVLSGQRRILRQAFARWHGREVDTQGDAFFVSFARAGDALGTVVEAQQALRTFPWPAGVDVRVRMGLHTGEPLLADQGYVGLAVHRAARLAHAGHGGQVLLSETSAALLRDELPDGVVLRDLGEYQLKDMARPERIFQLEIAGIPADFPPLLAEATTRHNLPQSLTPFIGRVQEIDQVQRLLENEPMVTLIGPGGVGKTRLSLQVARERQVAYPDGVWLVELAPLSDPTLVVQTVAHAAGVRDETGQPLLQGLLDFLCTRRTLLILDNCEHLVEACADLAAAVLQHCPQVEILASSREALAIPGEALFQVPSLAVPDPTRLPELTELLEIEAVRLFRERAAAVQPDFKVTLENAPAVAQICLRLDGIPLAIELAAARIRVLSAEQIAARLDDRFRLLTGGQRAALPRQQTLRATIDWSYQLLSEPERLLFRRLSVFVGGWTLEAAEAVCAGSGGYAEGGLEPFDVLDLLTHLVDKSLVTKGEVEGLARYRRLETVRQYALEKLLESGEYDFFRQRHLDWYLILAETAAAELEGPEQIHWLKRQEIEHDNLRAALEWSLESQDRLEAGLRLGGALAWFWGLRGYLSEGRERLAALLSAGSYLGSAEARARALSGAAGLAYLQSDYPATSDLYEQSLALYQTLGPEGRRGAADSLLGLGNVATEIGDYDSAPGLFERGLQIMRELEDPLGIADALRNLGWCAMRPGDYEQAKTYLQESLDLFRIVEDKVGIGSSLSGLGEVAIRLGDYEEARPLLEESLTLRRQLGNKWGIGASLGSLGWVALRQGDYAGTRALLAESLDVRREIGDVGGTAWCLEKLAEMAGEQGRFEDQIQIYAAASALRESIDSVIDPADQPEYQRIIQAAQAALGPARYQAAWKTGLAKSLEEVTALALQAERADDE